jgi:hypothetical protein
MLKLQIEWLSFKTLGLLAVIILLTEQFKFLEQLMVIQVVKKFLAFIDSYLLWCSQMPPIGSYPEADQSSYILPVCT